MTLKIRKGGIWQEMIGCQIRSGRKWRIIKAIKIYSGGQWRSVANFTSPGSGGSSTPPPTGGGGGGGGTGGGSSSPSITLTASPSTISGEARTSTIVSSATTATPSGGSAPYTYRWSIITESGATFAINASTLATTTVSAIGMLADTSANCTIRCVVTDSLGTTDTSNTVTATFYRPPVNTGGGGNSTL